MPRADRLFALVQLLSAPGRRRLDELARELGTSPRSIYRDLADLEARGVPIERTQGAYRLLDGATIRPVPLTSQERLLLTLALENPELQRQPAYRKRLRQLQRKLATAELSSIPAVLSGPERSGDIPEAIVEALEGAITARHSASILYTSLTSGSPAWRGIDPWIMLHRCEAWYLIGRCHVHDEPRTFRLDRIGAVLPIGQSFDRDEFDAERWFEHSWGVNASSEAHDVWIVFEPSVAPLIEAGQHHPGERKRRLDDGRLDYRARVGPLEELARWIAGFGGVAVAMSPRALVDRVHTIASGAAAAHRQKTRAAAMTRRSPS